MSGDNPLLSEFVRTGSEGAFRDLVSAYVNLVYSTAVRSVRGDTQLAEDIAQNVFIDLARKAVSLPPNIQLGGWLYRHTCFLASNAMRGERRRKARERQSVELRRLDDYTEENLQQLTGILDEVINELASEDRTAILLRFFEQLDFRSIGIAIGRSEDAARMRVSRALERLGSLLKRKGFILSAAGLGYFMGTKVSQAAPIALIDNATRAALASAFKGVSYFSLLKEACLTRLNVGLVGAAMGILLATLILFGGRQAKTTHTDRINWPRALLPEEGIEVKKNSSPRLEFAVVIPNTRSATEPEPITRTSAPGAAVRKVSEIRSRDSSATEPIEPKNEIQQVKPPAKPTLIAVPLIVNSQKITPNVSVSNPLAEKNKNEPSTPSRAPQSTRDLRTPTAAHTSATAKRLVAVPGRSNPATPQMSGRPQMQWVSGNSIRLPVRVMNGNPRGTMPSSMSGVPLRALPGAVNAR